VRQVLCAHKRPLCSRLTVKGPTGEPLSTTKNSDATYIVQQEPEGPSGPTKAGLVEYGADPDVRDDELRRNDHSVSFEKVRASKINPVLIANPSKQRFIRFGCFSFAKCRLFQVDVLLDPNSLAVGYQLIIEGVALGIFYGDIKEGVSVEVKTDNVNGKSELYLKNGNEVWHRVDLVSTSPKKTVEGSYKVLSF
jgi:hypothetical protein